MARFFVHIPIAGTATFEVEAADKNTAIAASWKKIDEGEEGDVTWEYYDQLVEGNVLHVPTNEVEVTRAKEESTESRSEGSSK